MEVRVLVFWDRTCFVAHGVELDLVAHAPTKLLAVQRFLRTSFFYLLVKEGIPVMDRVPSCVVSRLAKTKDLDVDQAFVGMDLLKGADGSDGPWRRVGDALVLSDGTVVVATHHAVKIGEKLLLRFLDVCNVLS